MGVEQGTRLPGQGQPVSTPPRSVLREDGPHHTGIPKPAAQYSPTDDPQADAYDNPPAPASKSPLPTRRQFFSTVGTAIAASLAPQILPKFGELVSKLTPSITADERKFILELAAQIQPWSIIQDPAGAAATFSGASPSGISLQIRRERRPDNVTTYALDVRSSRPQAGRVCIAFHGNSQEHGMDTTFIDNLIAAVQKSSGTTPTR